VTGVSFDMQPLEATETIAKHPRLGGFSLCVMDDNADFAVASATDDEYVHHLVAGSEFPTQQKTHTSNEPVGGSVGSSLHLEPNETGSCIHGTSCCP